MQIQLNGEPFEVASAETLHGLASTLDLGQSRYAIEVNMEIIPRSEHEGFCLKEGDNVEVVQAIGGG